MTTGCPPFAGMTSEDVDGRDKPGHDHKIRSINLLLGAADVSKLVGVDHHALAGDDEGRHQDAHAILKLRGFVGGRRGLALHDRVSLDHFERDLLRDGDADRLAFMALHRDLHALLQEGRALLQELLGKLDLVVGVHVHEHEHVALLVEELIVVLFEPHALDRL